MEYGSKFSVFRGIKYKIYHLFLMSDEFRYLLKCLRNLGTVEQVIPVDFNGKPTKFTAEIETKLGNKVVNMGLLHYNWNRVVGTDKVNLALQQVHRTNLDGVLMVAERFSDSAFEQAIRINKSEDKHLILLELDELHQAFGEPTSLDLEY